MENLIQNSRQSSIVLEKPGVFVWKTEKFNELQLKDLVSTHLFFTFLLITQYLKNQKNSKHPFADIVK